MNAQRDDRTPRTGNGHRTSQRRPAAAASLLVAMLLIGAADEAWPQSGTTPTIKFGSADSKVLEGLNFNFRINVEPGFAADQDIAITIDDAGGFLATPLPTSVRIPRGEHTSGNIAISTRSVAGVQRGQTVTITLGANTGVWNLGTDRSRTVPVFNNDTRPGKVYQVSATPTDGKVTLRWSRVPYNDIAIRTYQFRYREGNGEWNPQYLGAWVHAQPGDANDLSYTVGNFGALTNGKKHTFEVRAWNSAGGGAPARVTSTPTSGNDPAAPVISKLHINGGYGVEGEDENVGFAISLKPAATETVSVDYATEDLPAGEAKRAQAGLDYHGVSGTATFEPGIEYQYVYVPIIDDSHEDSGESFRMRLSNPSGAEISRATAPGTINNDEPDGDDTTEAGLSATFATSRFASTSHTGSSDSPQIIVEFSKAVAAFEKTTPSVSVTAGTVSNVQAHTEAGLENAYIWWITPDGDEDLTFTILANKACDDGGICTSSGTELTGVPAARRIPGPGKTLIASFESVPSEHNGTIAFTFDLVFTDEIGMGYAELRDDAFTVAEGNVTRASRSEQGKNDRWQITVDPDGDEDVTITLPGNRACSTTGAVCSKGDDPVQLSNSPTTTVAGPPEVVTATPNVSIAGGSGKEGDEDGIDFTVTLNEAASETVTVDYGTSDGSADAGDDYTAKSGTLSFSAGETSKTISVAIEDDIENESDETFTVTLSNASGANLGTASATGTILNRAVAPLTATFSNVPSEHDGSEFTFDLAFSENVKAGYARVRDDAVRATGATIEKARRKTQGSNQSWTIEVKPLGTGQIAISLPATSDCDATGAICTDDGRKLSHATSATVLGPVGISIGDVEVVEGANAVLVFAVSLTRAASSALTVDYATSDGTATAGADYNSTSGTLTINAGSSSGSIEVSVIDDEHNEGSETFTLTLSNASSGDLTDSSATGTITNHDALPAALVARFGRTAAVHIVDQVEARVSAPRAPGFDGRVAGRQINQDMGRDFALDFLQQLGGGYRYQQGQPGAGMTAAGTNDPRFTNSGMTSSLGPQNAIGGAMNPSTSMQGLHPGQTYDQGMGMGLGSDRLLQGSSFALNRATSSGGVLSFWSRSAQSQFYGQDGALALNGDVRTSMFGADYAKGRMVTGVSLSHSRGLGRYAGVDSGQVNSAVTGLYPWIGYKASERVTVWTVAGYGAGGLMLNPGAGAPIETGLSMAMAAGGGRGQILGGGEGFGLAFKADTLWVGMRTKAANGPGGNLVSTNAAVSRLRTALEGSQNMTIGKRMALTPSIEIGIRQDGGDAETGRGMDLGAGLVLADGVTGLAVDIRVRRLLVHQAEGFAESGMSISVSYNPTPSTPLGFTARVSPAWGGDSMSGAEALWGRESMGGMGQDHLLGGGGNRLDTEVGYGLPIGSRFVGTPRAGVRTSEYGRDYRIGYGMQVLEQGRLNLQLGVDAERRESPIFHLQEQNGGTDQRVLGRATVQW